MINFIVRHKLMHVYLLILLISSFGVSSVSACAQTDTIPFRLSDHNNLIIEVIINGVDKAELMFHTDARGITLIETATETMTSISWGEAGKATSWGGEHDSRVSSNNTFQIGTMHWDSLMVFEDQRSGPGTVGKFGPDVFEGKVIEVDFCQSIIVVSDSLKDDIDAYNKCPLFTEDGSMFIEGVSILGEAYPHKFLIHSGYGGNVLFDDEFVQQTNLGSTIEITEEQDLKDSFGNVIKTRKGTLPLFIISDLQFENLTVGFFDGSIGNQRLSIIGGGLLRQMNFVIDADRTYMYIKQRGE